MGAGKPIGESFQPGRDYSVGGQVYSGQTGQVIGSLSGFPFANRPVRSQQDNQIELARQKAAQAEAQARAEAEFARARAEAEFARAQAQTREAAVRSGQAAPSSQTYNSQPIAPPGVSDTPGVPGTGRSPFPFRAQAAPHRQPIAPPGVSDTPGVPGTGRSPFPFRAQAAPQGARTNVTSFRGSDLRVQREKESNARMQQELAYRQQLDKEREFQREAAKQLQAAKAAEFDARRSSREQAFQDRLNQERSGRAASESAFRSRLAETDRAARAQYDEAQRGMRMQNRLVGVARQEQMQRQFEEAKADAASRGRDDVVRQLGAEEANSAAQFENEDGFSINAYDQLLNRLRQIKSDL